MGLDTTKTLKKVSYNGQQFALDGEWQPDADMQWAKQVFLDDVQEGYEYKSLCLMYDDEDVSNIVIPSGGAVKTSDGGYYKYTDNGSSVTHTWNNENERQSVNHSFKVRWTIQYYDTDEGMSYEYLDCTSIYICHNCRFSVYFNRANTSSLFSRLEYIETLSGGVNISSTGAFEALRNLKKINSILIESPDSLFKDCTNLSELPEISWSDIYDSLSFNYMFQNCFALKEVLQLDTSKGTTFTGMFRLCYTLLKIPQLDTSNGTNFDNMFYYCYNLSKIPQLDTSKGTSFGSMFYACYSLKEIPQLDTSKGTYFGGMFQYCSRLKEIPQLDTSNGTNLANMFYGCYGLLKIPQLDTSKCDNIAAIFKQCYSLLEIPQLNTSNVTNFASMFDSCIGLKEVPVLDTSKGTGFRDMFNRAENLVKIPKLDFRSATGNAVLTNMFGYCYSLTELNVTNIRVPLQIGSGTSYGHLLTLDSLLNTIKELWDNTEGTSTKTLTVGTANKTKLANVYVKLIDITDEMRAEDEFIDLKLPFVVCESTDEGAMLVTDYVTSKNWTLA